jgi:hypothetical protein
LGLEATAVIDVSVLATLVQRIAGASGDPKGFDASAWTTRWLNLPSPVLGAVCPLDFMATSEGRERVRALIVQMQSRAYS